MMKWGFFFFLISIFDRSPVFAQKPCSWNYSSKKITDMEYEIHCVAEIGKNWHIYSQFTPEGGPMPTTITFAKNPLFIRNGKVAENGKIIIKYEKALGVDVKYFEDRVDFVQKIKLKTKAQTNVSGCIEFMACTDGRCLPPEKQNFIVPLQ